MKAIFNDASTTSLPLPAPSTVVKKALSNGLHVLHKTLCNDKAFTGVAMKLLQLLITLKAKEKSFTKFNDASYLPQSVRFKGDLKASKRITSSDEFVNLKDNMEAEVKAFQVSMSGYMNNSALLELPALKREALERTTKFADLMVKQKLLASGACRVHSRSSELTVRVFDNVEIEGGIGIPELRFGHDDTGVSHALGLDAVPNTQPDPILTEEMVMVTEVRKALKNTISQALLEFDNGEKENRLSQKTKEIILQEITVTVTDATTDKLNGDDVMIPDTDTGLQDLFSHFLIDHENKNHKNSVKGDRGAKDGKGASIKSQMQKTMESPNLLSKNQRKKQAAKRKKQQALDAAGSNFKFCKSQEKKENKEEFKQQKIAPKRDAEIHSRVESKIRNMYGYVPDIRQCNFVLSP